MSFLFLFQSLIATPLVTASGGVGFALYAKFLFPGMTFWQGKAVAMLVCLAATFLLYRNIRSIGRASMILFLVLLATMGWIIFAGLTHFVAARAFSFPPGAFQLSPAFFSGLGAAVLLAMYDYQGYFTVCLIGDEVRAPERNLPRSILLSIALLAFCYVAMNLSVIGVVPWKQAIGSNAIVADFMGRIYGAGAARFSAVLIMIAAFGSVFTVLLGFTRVPYAAAVEGNFFGVFARVHRTGFPSFSVVFMGVMSALACLLSLESLIDALIVIQVVTQFAAQCVAVVLIRRFRQDIHRPFAMYLYPVPVLIALAGWIFILVSSGERFIVAGFATVLVGVIGYLIRARLRAEWPFQIRQNQPLR